MTQEEFHALGTGIHYKLYAMWGGKKYRLTKTVQSTETCFLDGLEKKYCRPMATSYERVELVKT